MSRIVIVIDSKYSILEHNGEFRETECFEGKSFQRWHHPMALDLFWDVVVDDGQVPIAFQINDTLNEFFEKLLGPLLHQNSSIEFDPFFRIYFDRKSNGSALGLEGFGVLAFYKASDDDSVAIGVDLMCFLERKMLEFVLSKSTKALGNEL